MKRLRENICPLLLLLLMPAMSYLYTLANQKTTNVHFIATRLDLHIPFIKFFVLPYMFWHIFIPVLFIILCFIDRRTYFKIMLVYVVGCLISNITFALYQTTVLREPLIGNDFFTNLIRVIYANDNPVNCFPSIHVFTSYLMIKAVTQSKFSNIYTNLITSTIGFLIILSTLFVKQHAVLDVVSGILLAELLVIAVNRHEDKLLILWNKELFYKHSLRDIFNLNINEVDNDNDNDNDNYNLSV